MGPLGVQEIILIFILALVLFGPKKLPELGRMLGKAVSEFRKAKSELRSTWESHMAEIERETQTTTPSYTHPAEEHSPAEYSYSYEDYDRYDAEDQYETHAGPPVHEPEPAVHPAIAETTAGHAVATQSAAVAGSAAHVNGTSPGGSAPVSPKEEHPAA